MPKRYCEQDLRHVKLPGGFTLETWDTNRRDEYGKSILGYCLRDKDRKRIFAGEDFCCSPCHCVDSNESLHGLLTFLTLRPGDTDDEYFQDYTSAQLRFADEYGEELSGYNMHLEETKGEFEEIE